MSYYEDDDDEVSTASVLLGLGIVLLLGMALSFVIVTQ